MLDKLLKTFYKYVIAGIVVLLSIVFATQFGPQATGGCASGGARSVVADVYGKPVSEREFYANYRLLNGDRMPPAAAKSQNLREHVLNGLIERELLANEAREIGFDVTRDDAGREFVDGKIYVTTGVDAPAYMGSGPRNLDFRADGSFDLEGAKNYIQYGLRQSIKEFTESQVRELLAERMRETVMAGVTVSDREVWDEFVIDHEKARLSFIAFKPEYFTAEMKPTEAELKAWMEANAAKVQQEYDANKHRYTNLEEQVRARHILIKPDAANEDQEAAKAAARTKATRILAQVKGGADFEKLAREQSEDTGSARRGGDLGYNPRGRMVAAFDEAQFSLDVGAVSELVETQFGFHIIKVEGKRKGDVPEDEAKLELSERLYIEARGKTLAEEAAKTALASVRGGTSFEDAATAVRGADATVNADDAEEDPNAPKADETASFRRNGSPFPGGDNAAVLKAAFEELSIDAPFPEAPIQVGSGFYVVKLTERIEATKEDLSDDERGRIYEGLLGQRQREAVSELIDRLRKKADGKGAIRLLDESILDYGEANS